MHCEGGCVRYEKSLSNKFDFEGEDIFLCLLHSFLLELTKIKKFSWHSMINFYSLHIQNTHHHFIIRVRGNRLDNKFISLAQIRMFSNAAKTLFYSWGRMKFTPPHFQVLMLWLASLCLTQTHTHGWFIGAENLLAEKVSFIWNIPCRVVFGLI